MEPVIRVNDLSTYFYTGAGVLRAVDGVSLHVDPGETVALVGESGCGKTVCSLSIMRLVRPPGRVVGGEVWFEGRNLLDVSERRMRRIRGDKIAMVFQEPSLSFDPVYSVGAQLAETLVQHKKLGRREALRKAVELLKMVEIADAERRAASYPHEFSGGMLQRAMIALAISCEPRLLIADEPTTSLDVTIQAQVLELLSETSQSLGSAVLLITHNFGIVSRYAKRAYVMYAGQVVETGPVHKLYQEPQHPYTADLWASVLDLDRPKKTRVLPSGKGISDLVHEDSKCAYFPLCQHRELECERERPELVAVDSSHHVLCHRVHSGGSVHVKQ
ncbi:MAG: ABC transporter ATP-binding protein [Chloroflexi bacterium]|nr:ABC transporter ATP-binding protein [Chloroflexota bacterium]